jgi:hypothetical protein
MNIPWRKSKCIIPIGGDHLVSRFVTGKIILKWVFEKSVVKCICSDYDSIMILFWYDGDEHLGSITKSNYLSI